MKPDLQCIAQYSEDEQWYRAVVKSVDGSTATVHFIDYGNVESVKLEKLKEIESEFLKLAAQAVRCKLFCPGKLNWTKEESDKLSNIVLDKQLEVDFVTEDNGAYQVLLKETQMDSNSPKYINDLFILFS